MKNPTGRVRVIKTLSGAAPEWIREAPLGQIFPCYPILGFPENGESEKSAVTGKPVKYSRCNRPSVSVPQKTFLKILGQKNKKAANWWRSQGFPKQAPNDCFAFGEDEIKIISGVTRQKLEQYVGISETGC